VKGLAVSYPPERHPAAARAVFREGTVSTTAGWCPGYVQANLLAVPARYASDVLAFANRNPQACPLVGFTGRAGDHTTVTAPEADLRTDLPAYQLWRDGVPCPQVLGDVRRHWREDLVTFLFGCSFSAEQALIEAGVALRHVARRQNVAMYRTTVRCEPSGPIRGELIVSMRPIPEDQVPLVRDITSQHPVAHGGPVHVGDPHALGITDLDRPDFGDSVEVRAGEVPVFWACGLTPLHAVMAAKPDLAITHAPGHMFITDQLVRPTPV
jgi:uncharacterized protein YcsI (UPF0317 family)